MPNASLDPTDFASALAPLGEATTLPARAYTDEAIYAEEVERLFRGEWLCAGRVEQVANPGDYLSLDLLGDRLVVVRDKTGGIRVLSRICRHRAAELVNGSGNTRSFQCPYHLWTYGLDGELIGAPHMEAVPGFDASTCALPEIRSEIWEGFVFVNLDGEAEPLGPRLAPLSTLLADYRIGELVAEETATFDSPFNWKVLVDNFMEAYHHIATHADTLQPILPATRSHVTDSEGPYSVLVMPTNEDGEAIMPKQSLPGLSDEEQPGLIAAVVFPFHLFAPGPNSMAWYQFLPESVDRFTLRIYDCVPKDLSEEARAQSHAILKVIHEQDIGACEAVMAGLTSGRFERGPLALLEKSIWQFNQWWCERMLR
ncbi:MAG: aromatic ring-hydroxylating dioxygenase subunit alpha [bacterium]|nr:aromatic ring-hydroxylating dioxygenase subunit alpha [bacterium]